MRIVPSDTELKAVDGKLIWVSSARFMQREGILLPEEAEQIQTAAESKSFSLIYVGIDEQLAGIIRASVQKRWRLKKARHHLKTMSILRGN
jgi:cation transport ATPase